MELLKLCLEDPLVTTLTSIFPANIIRIPESRINPLVVFSRHKREYRLLGGVNDILKNEVKDIELYLEKSSLADLSGKKSSTINFELGFKILEGYLRSFGISSAGVKNHFKGVESISFSFKKVEREYINPFKIGKILSSQEFDTNNAMFDSKVQLFLIDSIITSKDFSVSLEKVSSKSINLNIPAIQDYVGKINKEIKVEGTTGLEVTFKGEKSLPFAFTCLKINTGKRTQIKLERGIGNRAISFNEKEKQMENIILFDTPHMINFE